MNEEAIVKAIITTEEAANGVYPTILATREEVAIMVEEEEEAAL